MLVKVYEVMLIPLSFLFVIIFILPVWVISHVVWAVFGVFLYLNDRYYVKPVYLKFISYNEFIDEFLKN